jgi:hypothetical protein
MQPAAQIAPAAGAGPNPALPAGADPGATAAPAKPLRWMWVGLIGLAFLLLARRVLRLSRQG